MNFKGLICLLTIVILAGSSCKKAASGKKTNPSTTVDVYVAGLSIAANGDSVATLWKNGIAIKLMDSSHYSEATAITANGNDIYTAGNITGGYGVALTDAVYWKNGVITRLPDYNGNSKAYGIALQANQVVITGGVDFNPTETGQAGVWTDTAFQGLLKWLKVVSNYSSSIAINGADIYIAGSGLTFNGNGTALYLKNGVVTYFGSSDTNYSANGVAVNGNDVYLAGTKYKAVYSTYTTAIYWKNGVISKPLDSLESSQANAIAVQGNDVYIAGNIKPNVNSVAACWKNGVAIPLAHATSFSVANSIAVNGNDVYIAGTNALGAVYWKNGVETQLPGRGRASCIIVVSH